MTVRRFLFALFITAAIPSTAQTVSHFAKIHYAKFTSKDIYMLGYEAGIHKMTYSVSAGFGNGSDMQFLAAADVDDGKKVQEVKESQTIFPAMLPPNSYLERCNSQYSIRQLRAGFTVFVRNNDTLNRQQQTGLHFGVEAILTSIRETQTVTYKSDLNEMRYSFSGINKLNAFGAGTHIGWQFAFFKSHLYLDLRAVIPFYYPFMEEPNLNSPFAGNKYEIQGSIGWRFYKVKENEVKESDGEKVRDKI